MELTFNKRRKQKQERYRTVNKLLADNSNSIGDNNNNNNNNDDDNRNMTDCHSNYIVRPAGRSQCEMLIIAWLQV